MIGVMRLRNDMRLRTVGLLCLAAGIGSCVEPSPVETGPDARVLFLVQRAQPTEALEAEFRGRVEVDQAGCLRLAAPDRSTVLWPVGSSLVRDNASLIILDVGGATLARVGELLRLGGGVITDLETGNHLGGEMLEAALERCPGSYWLVGEVFERALQPSGEALRRLPGGRYQPIHRTAAR